jgi:hypothetical protein
MKRAGLGRAALHIGDVEGDLLGAFPLISC